MIWTIILWLSVIWIAPLLFVIMVNETRFKKNIVLGVTLPYDARENTEVQSTLKAFRLWSGIVTVLLTGSAVILMILQREDFSMTAWFVWVDLGMSS